MNSSQKFAESERPDKRRLAGLTRLELATFRVTGGRSDQTELQPQPNNKLAPRAGFEPATQRLTVVCSTTELPRNKISKWWAVQDSNLRPPVCKTEALPTELTALKSLWSKL